MQINLRDHSRVVGITAAVVHDLHAASREKVRDGVLTALGRPLQILAVLGQSFVAPVRIVAELENLLRTRVCDTPSAKSSLFVLLIRLVPPVGDLHLRLKTLHPAGTESSLEQLVRMRLLRAEAAQKRVRIPLQVPAKIHDRDVAVAAALEIQEVLPLDASAADVARLVAELMTVGLHHPVEVTHRTDAVRHDDDQVAAARPSHVLRARRGVVGVPRRSDSTPSRPYAELVLKLRDACVPDVGHGGDVTTFARERLRGVVRRDQTVPMEERHGGRSWLLRFVGLRVVTQDQPCVCVVVGHDGSLPFLRVLGCAQTSHHGQSDAYSYHFLVILSIFTD